MSLVADYQGPRRGVDRAVLLAHGAGADRRAAALTVVADALADSGIPSLRFDYPYRTAGRKAPDRPSVLEAATREAAAMLARTAGLAPERLVLGGRSMGGRYCSLIVAATEDPVPALGLVLLGYPLQAMGKPERRLHSSTPPAASRPVSTVQAARRRRDEHFGRLGCPVLFVSGTRDSLAPKDALTHSAQAIPGPVTFDWIETADHGFRPLKRSGTTLDAVLSAVAETCVTWVRSLDGGSGNTV